MSERAREVGGGRVSVEGIDGGIIRLKLNERERGWVEGCVGRSDCEIKM